MLLIDDSIPGRRRVSLWLLVRREGGGGAALHEEWEEPQAYSRPSSRQTDGLLHRKHIIINHISTVTTYYMKNVRDITRSKDTLLLSLIARLQRELVASPGLRTSRLKRDQDNGIYGFIKKTVNTFTI